MAESVSPINFPELLEVGMVGVGDLIYVATISCSCFLLREMTIQEDQRGLHDIDMTDSERVLFMPTLSRIVGCRYKLRLGNDHRCKFCCQIKRLSKLWSEESGPAKGTRDGYD